MRTLLTAIIFLCAGPGLVFAQLNIVATIPDLADIARQIGGDLVKVESLAKGTEDIHAVPQRPSFIPKLAHAHGIIHLGLWAEHAFLPALLEASANANLEPGGKGDIDASLYVSPMDVPTSVSRDQGEQHPDGNPHYNTDPRKGTAIARAIAEAFGRLDPVNSATYEKNRAEFDRVLSEKLKAWDKKIAGLKGKKGVSYHKDMIYFANYLGIDLVGHIELKPGIAPSPRHLEELVVVMKTVQASIILYEIQYPDQAAKWVAAQTGAKIAPVATMGGAFPGSQTYIGMIDHNINSVVEAFR